jgi:hypothetical protein
MGRLLGFVVLGLTSILNSPGQETPNLTFEQLLERVKKADPGVDFQQVRMAYTRTPEYSRMTPTTREARQ